jgi:hypothetical protein
VALEDAHDFDAASVRNRPLENEIVPGHPRAQTRRQVFALTPDVRVEGKFPELGVDLAEATVSTSGAEEG